MKRVAMVVAMAMAVVGSVFAQEIVPNIDEGTKELRISGSYDADTPLDHELSVGGGFGYFFRDGLEVALEMALQDNDLLTLIEVGAFVEYNFETGSAWVPFIGLGGFYIHADADGDFSDDSDADTGVGKAGAGVKYFIRDDIAISLRADYSFAADDVYIDDDGDLDDTNFKTVLALRVYWD